MKNKANPAETRILVADDNRDILNSTARLLENAGYSVDRADGGAAALASAREHHPNLVLLDRDMPGMNGLEVCRAIRTDPTLTGVFVVFVSGVNVASEEQSEGLESGADGYITRPISNRELLARVEAYVRILSLNRLLQQHVAELQQSRRAALNLMEEAVQVREQLNAVNQELQNQVIETKRSEASMFASEARYRRLFEAAKDGILILNAETGSIVDVNPFLMELLGYSHKDFLGKKVWELGFFKDRVTNQDNFAELQAKEYIRYENLALETSDGRRIEVEFISNVYLVGGDKVIQCNVRDISERKRGEEAAARLAAIVQSSDDAIIGKNLDGTVTSWNAGAEKVFGYAAHEMVGQPILKLIPPERHHEETEIIASIRRGEGIRHFDTVRVRQDGSTIDVSITVSPIRDATGKIIGVSKIARDITDQKRAAAALRESEANLAVGQRHAKVGSWEFNPATRTGKWSAEMFRLFDRDPAAGVPDFAEFLKLVHPDDHPIMAENEARAMQTGEPVSYEYRSNPARGPLKHFDVTIHAIRDAAGNITRLAGTVQDITVRKQAEAAVRASETRYRRLFETTKDGILILDAETGMVMDVNPFLIALLGFSHEEFLGKKVWELGFFKDIVANQDNFAELQQKEYIRYEDMALETSTGRRIEVEFTSNVFRINEQKVIQCSIRDISVRKAAEEKQRASDLRYRRLFETTKDGILILDAETGMVMDVNPFLIALLGFSHEEFLGKKVWELGFFKDIVANQDNFAELQQKEYIRYEDMALESSAGHRIEVEFTSNLFLVNRHKVIQCDIRDITRRKRAEAAIRLLNDELEQRVVERTTQLEEANKELESFSYSVSHDLRAPLRAVNGFAKIVLDTYAPQLPAEARELLADIRAGGQQMGVLIDDLLAFSRLGRQTLKLQPVDTAQLVQAVLDELAPQRTGRPFEIKVGALPVCQGDPALLKQVWLNLIANAIKYTRGRTPAVIEIGCQRNDAENIYFVCDNGAGFDMRYVHKLFGVFQRLHRAEEFEGTGVGLAIVQRIIHRHGGRVWAESSEGHSARFQFTLGQEK